MLIKQGSAINLTENNSVELVQLKRKIAIQYSSERVVPILPALRELRRECDLSRNEILTLLAAKRYQRKNEKSFTAKDIALTSGIGYNNVNAYLNKLSETGHLKIEVRGRKGDYLPSRYCLTKTGVAIVARLDELTYDFIPIN